jgi:Na+/H+-dicarboxylate symporter
VNEAIMKMVRLIMWIAPIGVFALVASRLGQHGGGAGVAAEVVKIGKYFFTVLIGLGIHGFIVLPLILRTIGRRKILPYAGGMLEALTTAWSTASSSATLPITMRCAHEHNKVSRRSTMLVTPLGATINMDGTALYEAVAAIFIAQAVGFPLDAGHQVIIFLTATLAAIGAAGIPEAGLVTMVIVLNAVGLPLEGIGLILTVDWFLDRFRTTVNVWGDAVGTAVMDRFLGPEEETNG